MRLPKVPDALPPAIKIKQRSANYLVELYHEMINVHNHEVAFDQNASDMCVIGNGLRAGVIPKTDDSNWDSPFTQAINKIGIDDELLMPNGEAKYDTVNEYLFGGVHEINKGATDLLLARGRNNTTNIGLDEIDACVRIASVLDRAGYDISELPSLPRKVGENHDSNNS